MAPSAFGKARQRLLAYIVSGTMFMAQLDSTIINTALPKMAESFGTGATNLSLGVSVYLLAQAVLLPASNWISDRFGARRVFASAVLLFTLASILCGLSGTLSQFVAARVAQGGAAALMTPVGRVVLVRAIPREDLVRVLTMTAAPMLLAPMLGPPVGGFIVSYLSWPWVFYLNVPFGVLCAVLILRSVPDYREAVRRPFDLAGFTLIGLGLTGLIYGFDRITAPHNPRLVPALCIVGGMALSVAAVRHAQRVAHPLFSLRPFRAAPFRAVAGGGSFFARLPMRAVPFVMPLALQIGLGLNAFIAGLLLTASAVGDLVIKPLVGPILERVGFRRALIGSQLLSTLALAILALVLTAASPIMIMAVLALVGCARSVLFSGMGALLYADMDEEDMGSATVIWNVALQLTNAFAVSFSVILLNLLGWARGGYGGHPSIGDFRITLLLLAALGIPAILSFRKLAADAGANLSGHIIDE